MRSLNPTLTITASLSLLFTFVASLYISKSFNYRKFDRNDKVLIRNRCVAVSVVSFFWVLILHKCELLITEFEVLKFLKSGLHGIVVAVMILFGAFYVILKNFQLIVTDRPTRLMFLRTYVIGPVSEEICFRLVLCTILESSELSTFSVVLFSAFLFSAAHLHHLLVNFFSEKSISGNLFQLVYSFIFGIFAAFLFIKTQSIGGSLTSHILCNFVGQNLPEIDFTDVKKIIFLEVIGFVVGFWYLKWL
jgi:prenyl protein peptidase